ncbi:hypothetical protein GTO89_04720 [Heliobacterium gestii]|uniref:Uncharacterized protein n=1 Tax=Heliomicrobium gestii TaxID=2699 RepID=A0A845LAL5_HELGE|nr:hypothetical protein [Heliomicrobium gestii]MBM7866917.1 hypothetical protein [Heliomicrobium gestii]MZP42344.1 hypothetical protein [Heliomicrobium gestii]
MVFQELASEGNNVGFMVNHLTVEQFDRYVRVWIWKCDITMKKTMPRSTFTKRFYQLWSKAKKIDEKIFDQLLHIIRGLAAIESEPNPVHIG